MVGDAAKQMVLADIRSMVRILLMSIPGKILAMTIRNTAGAEVRRLNRHPKTTVGRLATPAVSQNLRLRYNNVDVAAVPMA